MNTFKQFICRKGKIPVDYRTGNTADPHNPEIWTDRNTAETAAMLRPGHDIGFVFTDNDPFFFIDIDHALQSDGKWSKLMYDLVTMCPDAYSEVSESNKGVHIIGSFSGIFPEHLCKNSKLDIELYTSKRFVALTGKHACGTAETDCTAGLLQIIDSYFKKSTVIAKSLDTGSGLSDAEILKKALSAKNPFNSQNNFKNLWEANAIELAKRYPASDGIRAYDYSSADAALAQHLAFWTGNNPEQMECLMRQSALIREKWQREDYLPRTISHAISLQEETYQSLVTPDHNEIADIAIRSGLQFLTPAQQNEHFKGCVYIQDVHRVFTPNGELLKPEQFKATYGGHIFALDSLNSKTTTNAWQAFTETQALSPPRAHTQCFRPRVASGSVIEENGRKLANVYVPIKTPRKSGDSAPFINHLATILPDKTDQIILTSYLAACIQYKGVKFQWCPLLQGVEGNGKTLFTRCVAAAIGRKYTHLPKASDLDNKFNAWLLNKLFIGVEDIYVPEDRTRIIETLKPMITGVDGIEIQAKGVDQITSDICANFIINSNHKDALRKTHNDRRFCIFYCVQQQAADLYKDGLHGDYFPKLYDWLRKDGYAIVHDYLAFYKISDEFNPANGCHRAPETSTTQSAIAATAGSLEQEILEAIGEERPGFKGGWVSSMALAELIKSMRRIISANKRREIMVTLGYDWHPNLPEGRISRIILPDAGKPKLFIKNEHPCLKLIDAAAIAEAYTAAQINVG